MRPNRLFSPGHLAIIGASLISLFLLSSTTLKAQTPINFSGKWELDKTKSSPGTVKSDFDGTVVRRITQDSSTIAYRDIYTGKGGNNWETSDELFNLDGKEQIEKEGDNTSKKSTKWSQDKKTLTLTYICTYAEEGVLKELLDAESYKLSDGGKTLTIETSSKNRITGETKVKSVFHKKSDY